MNISAGDWVADKHNPKVQGRVVRLVYRREPGGCENIAGKLVLQYKHTHFVRLWLHRRWLFLIIPVDRVRVIRKGK